MFSSSPPNYFFEAEGYTITINYVAQSGAYRWWLKRGGRVLGEGENHLFIDAFNAAWGAWDKRE